ncbi:serpin family protein [Candidatus Lokiarchaeum ossiferum]|uniref:serpin family protein n=1 Tax=Candidatus Lokiarchaeum ossiferum TaxID=2951803 RepID=UPI00352CAEDE
MVKKIEALEIKNGLNQFAIELFLTLGDSNKAKNIFFSPYSIFSAFALAYEGSMGKTRKEIQGVLHFSDNEVLRKKYLVYHNWITQKKTPFELQMGNALWIQGKFPLLDQFVQVVSTNYGGTVKYLDFVNEGEKSRQTINDFIKDATRGHITNLIPPKSLKPMTRLIITNAIYFHGDWEQAFDPMRTRLGQFHLSPEKTITIPMMTHGEESFNYKKFDDVEILELPYKGNQISMYVLLPTHDISTFESSLSIDKFEKWKNELVTTKLKPIMLPKFKFQSKFFLKKTLQSMGMLSCFHRTKANFSQITTEDGVFIDNVIHQAVIAIDEQGTEAAAATSLQMTGKSKKRLKPRFIADHPFIFVIQDHIVGNILFMGKMMDPTQL